MNKNCYLIVWNKKHIHMSELKENEPHEEFSPRKQAQEIARFLTGHVTSNSLDCLCQEIAALVLPYDKINDETMKETTTRILMAIERTADN